MLTTAAGEEGKIKHLHLEIEFRGAKDLSVARTQIVISSSLYDRLQLRSMGLQLIWDSAGQIKVSMTEMMLQMVYINPKAAGGVQQKIKSRAHDQLTLIDVSIASSQG